MPRPKPGLKIDLHVPESPWDQEAACRGDNLVDLFFDEEDDVTIEQAKRICSSCPVRATCLEMALAFREPVGVWGGMSTNERNTLLRRRRRYNVA